MSISRQNLLLIALIFIVSFSVRLLFFINTEYVYLLQGDAISYVQYANNLIEYGVFSKSTGIPPTPDSYWAPGFPLFLAGCILFAKLFSLNDYHTIMLLHNVIGALIPVVTFIFALSFTRLSLAILAAALTAVSPHLISYSSLILSETLFCLFALLSVHLTCIYARSPSIKRAVITGLIYGITYLINPIVIILPLISIAYFFLSNRKSFKAHSTILTCFLLFIFGWTLRTQIFVPEAAAKSSDRLFINLIIGSHPSYHERWKADPKDPNNPVTIDEKRFSGSYSAFLSDLFDRIQDNPAMYAKWYLIDKPLNLWRWDVFVGFADIFVYPVYSSPYHESQIAMISHRFMKTTHWWLWSFAFIVILMGLLNRQGTPQEIKVLIVTLIYSTAVYSVTQADSRYSVPFRPELYLMAVFFMHRTYDLFKNNKVNNLLQKTITKKGVNE